MRLSLVMTIFVAAVLLAGCGGESASSSIAKNGAGDSDVITVPVPANPIDLDDEETTGETGEDVRQITRADGSTPPPRPTVVR